MMRAHCIRLTLVAWLAIGGWCAVAVGDVYEVGPGKGLAAIGDVPWESLGPGDRVLIHWRAEPYREKWVICRRGTEAEPIVVRGVAGPGGERPVIDGRDAVTRPQLNYWGEERGLVKVGGANRPADTTPAHIVIENLELRSARPPYRFTGRAGEGAYFRNAAALFIEKGEHITIRNCVLRDSGNGLFVASQSSDIVVEGCHLHSNGNEGSIYEHNAYTQAKRLTYQFNRFGPLRDGCGGNNLKDRSAGLVVRYNWIEGGNRQLDLVDASNAPHLRDDPAYRETFVYGNVLLEHGEGNNQIVHYGGDSGETGAYRKGTLYFHHNTVVSRRPGTTTLFRLSTPEESADCRNNIVYVAAADGEADGGGEGDGSGASGGGVPGRRLGLMATEGRLHLSHNFFKDGYVMSHSRFTGETNRDHDSITADAPGFRDLRGGDYGLAPESPSIGAATAPHPRTLPDHATAQRYVPHGGGEPRETLDDLGAFPFSD